MIRFGLQQIITLDMDEVLRPNGETGVYPSNSAFNGLMISSSRR